MNGSSASRGSRHSTGMFRSIRFCTTNAVTGLDNATMIGRIDVLGSLG